jgi:hypothetical protein
MNQMIESPALDRDTELFHVREVRGCQSPRHTLRCEEHFAAPASDRTQSCKNSAAGLRGLLTKLIALFIPECEWCSSFVLLEAYATEFAVRAQIAV